MLLHEASHAVMAQRYGFPVSSITLHFLGGMTAIEGEARNAARGVHDRGRRPAHLARGRRGVASASGSSRPTGCSRWRSAGLAGANLLVGVLNLVPGLPLDGGRVLKAVVWGVTGNAHRGTLVAGWGGRVTAVAVLGWPLLIGQVTGVEPDAPRLRPGVRHRAVPVVGRDARDGLGPAAQPAARPAWRATSPGAPSPSPTTCPLGEAVRRAQEAEAGSIVTVTSGGVPVGVVNEAALLATPEERRPWVAVLDGRPHPRRRGSGCRPTYPGEDLILAISRRPRSEYLLVEDDGSIYGVLSTADVDQAFREHRAGDRRAGPD